MDADEGLRLCERFGGSADLDPRTRHGLMDLPRFGGVPTGMGELRNGLVARAGDAVIAVGGEFGTLSEIAFALKLGRPVIGLRTWQLARRGSAVDAVQEAGDPVEAVSLALAAVAQSMR